MTGNPDLNYIPQHQANINNPDTIESPTIAIPDPIAGEINQNLIDKR
jgi:hypothetical protein